NPHWGAVRCWLIPSGKALLAEPPPAEGSEAFHNALDEVKRYSERRTPEQGRIAAFWADGDGSYAPAGRWNKIACDLLALQRWSELRAARALALLNMAVMDAGIACWASKYHYFVRRPWQV